MILISRPITCANQIAIASRMPRSQLVHTAAAGSYGVYSAQCDTFRDHSNSPKLRWTADYALEITFSINSTALVTRDVRLRKLDDSKQVNVRYVVENDPNPNQ
jgi:hypothetical protein